MALKDLSRRDAVIKALKEFDEIGREKFLQKYGFSKARSYWLFYNGRRYDSKAIVDAAHGFQFPDIGPLKHQDFSGGDLTVRKKLNQLGFYVESTAGRVTSAELTDGSIYTREDLKGEFSITDATINTGVFKPKGTASIWLFVTRNKTSDRTQYVDRLEGDYLYWQGQTLGRTDQLIVNHKKEGNEILVFFRESKLEHPGAGFRYLGEFDYIAHSGRGPTNFILRKRYFRNEAFLPVASDANVEFNPDDIQDARQTTMRSIAQRRGQGAFRSCLSSAYGAKCVISDCNILEILEAAHIYPYMGDETNHLSNGLLLCADLNTLLDCGLLSINPDNRTCIIAPSIRDSECGVFHLKKIRPPATGFPAPSIFALRYHYHECAF